MSQKQRKPKAFESGHIDASVDCDSDGDGAHVKLSGCYLDDPKDIQRLINFLSKAKKWVAQKQEDIL